MDPKRVLVTGGSRGIGRAIALRLADDGWSVAVHFANREDAAQEVASALGERSAGLYQADFSDPASASQLWDQVLADGPIHALVNNAGIYVPHKVLELGDDAFAELYRQTFTTNFESPLLLARRAVRHFARSGGGRVLNVCSRVGFKAEAGAALYAASKAALVNLTRSWAVELAEHNVRLFGIAPGWVDTAMARDGMDQRLTEILSTLPLGRMASPEDCAHAAAFLLSDASDYLSGVVLDINGASYFH